MWQLSEKERHYSIVVSIEQIKCNSHNEPPTLFIVSFKGREKSKVTAFRVINDSICNYFATDIFLASTSC